MEKLQSMSLSETSLTHYRTKTENKSCKIPYRVIVTWDKNSTKSNWPKIN